MDQNASIENEIELKNLPFKSWLLMSWALFWRCVTTSIVSALAGGIIGGIIGGIVGVICSITNFPFESIKIPLQIISGLIGLSVGFVFLVLMLKWFFRAKFRDFRIAILSK